MTDKEQREAWLVEYQKAQDSAQHFDTLIWTSSGLVITLVGAVIGFFSTSKVSVGINTILLLFLLLYALFVEIKLVKILTKRKNTKYARCRYLEKTYFNFEQHSNTTVSGGSKLLVSLLELTFFIVLFIFVTAICSLKVRLIFS